MVIYVADFETTTIYEENLELDINNKELEVWLSAFSKISSIEDRDSYHIQDNIQSFFIELIDDIFLQPDTDIVVFFHNLKFDGSFIIHFLEKKGIEYETFINDMGSWYSITLNVEGYNIVFRDSLKILNFSLAQIAKNILGGKVLKGDTPILDKKPEKIQPEWIEYVKTDIEILGKAIRGLYEKENFTKFTAASETLKVYKENYNKNFKYQFPKIDENIDKILRKGYKGGWTFANPRYQNKIINNDIVVYDKNSMYPAIMLNYALPYGKPKEYKGYKEPKLDKLYIYQIKISFDIKDKHLPTIQIKDKKITTILGKRTTDYLYSSNDFIVDLVVTNYDLDLIKKHYNCEIDYIRTFEFNSKMYMFTDFINHFSKEKIEGKKEGNLIKTQKAKLMLNSLYGKFGSRVEQRTKSCHIENGVLKFELDPVEIVDPIYLPVAMFITSIGRHEVITDAQKNYDYFLYSDTDSVHLIDHEGIDLPIDKYKFGYWDLEYRAKRGKFLRSKLYIEEKTDGEMVIRGAGMVDEVKKQVTFDNFNIGQVYHGKKATMQVKGGVLIYNTDFTIKDFNDLF